MRLHPFTSKINANYLLKGKVKEAWHVLLTEVVGLYSIQLGFFTAISCFPSVIPNNFQTVKPTTNSCFGNIIVDDSLE